MQKSYGYYDDYGEEYDPYGGLTSDVGYQAQAHTAVWDTSPTWVDEPEEIYTYADEAYGYEYAEDVPPDTAVQPDLILWGGVALVLVLLALGLWRWVAPLSQTTPPPVAATPAPDLLDPNNTLVFPYDDYVLTQGPHGYSYGHMAIDISAGNGATIKSPIAGSVTQFYFDGLGNSVLVIENDKYQMTMLHGEYTVEVGDKLRPGDAVGTESNLGNTYDWAGNSCRGRDCGYHTHLNVFDKELGSNVNPLDLFYGTAVSGN